MARFPAASYAGGVRSQLTDSTDAPYTPGMARRGEGRDWIVNGKPLFPNQIICSATRRGATVYARESSKGETETKENGGAIAEAGTTVGVHTIRLYTVRLMASQSYSTFTRYERMEKFVAGPDAKGRVELVASHFEYGGPRVELNNS